MIHKHHEDAEQVASEAPDSNQLKEEEWIFRRAVREDVSSLLGLLVLCYAEFPEGCIDPQGTCASVLRNAGGIYETGGAIWVAQHRTNRIDGCFFLDYPNPDLAVIRFFLVQPDLVKTQSELLCNLAHYATSKAQELGGRDVGLWHDDRFIDTISLFQELGYRPTGARRTLGDVSGTTETYYARSLWYQPEPIV